MHVVAALAALERDEPVGPLVLVHGQGAVKRRGDAVHVVGVHVQRLVHGLGGAGESREDQHAGVGGLARDVLLCDQVHPVAERRHQGDVRVPVEGGEPFW